MRRIIVFNSKKELQDFRNGKKVLTPTGICEMLTPKAEINLIYRSGKYILTYDTDITEDSPFPLGFQWDYEKGKAKEELSVKVPKAYSSKTRKIS